MIRIILLNIFVWSSTLMVNGQDKPANVLDQFRWENRLAVIVSNDQSFIDQQIKRYNEADNNEWVDRKLKWICITPDQYQISGQSWKQNTAMYDKYGSAKEEGMCLLIGLDGGIKKEWNRLTQPKELYELIDQMPMRIREKRGY